jgi:hypothetical protein
MAKALVSSTFTARYGPSTAYFCKKALTLVSAYANLRKHEPIVYLDGIDAGRRNFPNV